MAGSVKFSSANVRANFEIHSAARRPARIRLTHWARRLPDIIRCWAIRKLVGHRGLLMNCSVNEGVTGDFLMISGVSMGQFTS